MPPNIVILGWGSLIWDTRPEFDEYHELWQRDGPTLPLEFTRVSSSRDNALTLVIDEEHGSSCQVSFARSTRHSPEDAIADLRCRERTKLADIGYYFRDGSRSSSRSKVATLAIVAWANQRHIDVVIWTDLSSNFQSKSSLKCPFSVAAAVAHLQSLPPSGKAKAAEYLWRAPQFIDTPLRRVVQAEPWFQSGA